MTKFCKDCTYVIGQGQYAKCGKDPRGSHHLVTGDPRDQEYFHCSVTRQHGCGPRGRWFEPKVLPKPKPDIDLGDGPIIEGEVVNGHEAPRFIQRLLARIK